MCWLLLDEGGRALDNIAAKSVVWSGPKSLTADISST